MHIIKNTRNGLTKQRSETVSKHFRIEKSFPLSLEHHQLVTDRGLCVQGSGLAVCTGLYTEQLYIEHFERCPAIDRCSIMKKFIEFRGRQKRVKPDVHAFAFLSLALVLLWFYFGFTLVLFCFTFALVCLPLVCLPFLSFAFAFILLFDYLPSCLSSMSRNFSGCSFSKFFN